MTVTRDPINPPVGNEIFRTPFKSDEGPLPPPDLTFFILQESGDKIILEDGSGFMLTEMAP